MDDAYWGFDAPSNHSTVPKTDPWGTKIVLTCQTLQCSVHLVKSLGSQDDQNQQNFQWQEAEMKLIGDELFGFDPVSLTSLSKRSETERYNTIDLSCETAK
jgi:hypothetical protein